MSTKTDANITQDVLDELAWDPANTIADLTISTDHGRVTLAGTADTYGTSLEAEDAADEDAAMILGVKGLEDEIFVDQPQASAADISSGIAQAFARNAELYDDDVEVAVDGNQVTLSGTVATWGEYEMAEDTAWMAPGVSSVTNNIAVLFP